MDHPHHWLALAFTAMNAIRALFYVPQIIAVARSTDGARDIALCTWWMWAVNNLLGALYSGIALGDEAMALSFVASVAGCGATIGLTMWKRRSYCRVLQRETSIRQPSTRAGPFPSN